MSEIQFTPQPDMLRYDVDTMKALVGTTLTYSTNKYKVLDYVHHHLLLGIPSTISLLELL